MRHIPKNRAFFLWTISTLFILGSPLCAGAATSVTYNASDLIPKTEIFFSPAQATFTEGSVFEVPVFINTKGTSINTVELHLKFDPHHLSIVQPSAGKSVIGLWLEAPKYDNTKGTLDVVGSIPNGINSSSGLIVSMSFRAVSSGNAELHIDDTSKLLSNDGVGTMVAFESNRATYKIVPKPPEGVEVFSETHPFEDRWYNNPNPVLNWLQENGIAGFNYILNNIPSSVPDNTIKDKGTIRPFENLKDGIWYFHIKAYKQGVWGNTTHRIIRIDRTPPAEFRPTVNFLAAAVIQRPIISFFTTDALSGLDHYEVGIINTADELTASPVFVQAESPFQVPVTTSGKIRVFVRAFDRAGNVRDESIDVEAWSFLASLMGGNIFWLFLAALVVVVCIFIFHHYFGSHLIRRLRTAFQIVKKGDDPPVSPQ